MAATQKSPVKRTVVALLLLVPAPSLGVAAAMFWWPGSPAGKVIFLAGKLWLAALPLVWRWQIDRAPLSWSPPRHGGFGVAALSGILIAGIVFAAYGIAGRCHLIDAGMVAERAAKIGLNQPAVYFAGAIYWITLNSLMEEYVWRWFVFRKFEALIGSRGAVAAAALAFTAHHAVALTAHFHWPVVVLGSLGVFAGGAIWSGLYRRYRSVWPGYVSHAIVDAAIFVIGWRLIFGGG